MMITFLSYQWKRREDDLYSAQKPNACLINADHSGKSRVRITKIENISFTSILVSSGVACEDQVRQIPIDSR